MGTLLKKQMILLCRCGGYHSSSYLTQHLRSEFLIKLQSHETLIDKIIIKYCMYQLTKPSLINLRMFCLELALAISLISLGSNQTLFLPHFITLAANRFCSFKELIMMFRRLHEKQIFWKEKQNLLKSKSSLNQPKH